jgi:riboflavin transporter FmnP
VIIASIDILAVCILLGAFAFGLRTGIGTLIVKELSPNLGDERGEAAAA